MFDQFVYFLIPWNPVSFQMGHFSFSGGSLARFPSRGVLPSHATGDAQENPRTTAVLVGPGASSAALEGPPSGTASFGSPCKSPFRTSNVPVLRIYEPAARLRYLTGVLC